MISMHTLFLGYCTGFIEYLFSHTHCPIYTLILHLSLTKSGYLRGLPDLSGVTQGCYPRDLADHFVTVVTWSVFICSVTDLRGCSGGVDAPSFGRALPLVLVVAIGVSLAIGLAGCVTGYMKNGSLVFWVPSAGYCC